MRVNRDIVRMMLDNGTPLKYGVDRAVGRTTALALRALADAIDNPGKEIRPTDHYRSFSADRNLLRVCAGMVEKLGLQKFTINQQTLRCDFSEAL